MSGPYEAAEEPIFFDGAYMAYTATTYGATSIVVAVVWGTYLAYIVNAYGATSIVVANAGRCAGHTAPEPLAHLGAVSRSLTALGARGSLLRSLITIWPQGPR